MHFNGILPTPGGQFLFVGYGGRRGGGHMHVGLSSILLGTLVGA